MLESTSIGLLESAQELIFDLVQRLDHGQHSYEQGSGGVAIRLERLESLITKSSSNYDPCRQFEIALFRQSLIGHIASDYLCMVRRVEYCPNRSRARLLECLGFHEPYPRFISLSKQRGRVTNSQLHKQKSIQGWYAMYLLIVRVWPACNTFLSPIKLARPSVYRTHCVSGQCTMKYQKTTPIHMQQ